MPVPHYAEYILEMIRTDLIEESYGSAKDDEVISDLLTDVDVSIVHRELGERFLGEGEFPGNVGRDFVLQHGAHHFTFGHGNSLDTAAIRQ